jgi:hypothetical protein
MRLPSVPPMCGHGARMCTKVSDKITDVLTILLTFLLPPHSGIHSMDNTYSRLTYPPFFDIDYLRIVHISAFDIKSVVPSLPFISYTCLAKPQQVD